MNCLAKNDDGPDSTIYDKMMANIVYVCASLNIVGCVFIITSYLAHKDLWTKTTLTHIFHKSIWYIMYSVSMLFSSTTIEELSIECKAQFYLAAFSSTAVAISDLWVAIDVYLTIYGALFTPHHQFISNIKRNLASYVQIPVAFLGTFLTVYCAILAACGKPQQTVWGSFFCSFRSKRLLMISYYMPMFIKAVGCAAVTLWLVVLICVQRVTRLRVVFKMMLAITTKSLIESVVMLTYRCKTQQNNSSFSNYAVALCISGLVFVDAILWVNLPPLRRHLKMLYPACEMRNPMWHHESDIEVSDEHIGLQSSLENFRLKSISCVKRFFGGGDTRDSSGEGRHAKLFYPSRNNSLLGSGMLETSADSPNSTEYQVLSEGGAIN